MFAAASSSPSLPSQVFFGLLRLAIKTGLDAMCCLMSVFRELHCIMQGHSVIHVSVCLYVISLHPATSTTHKQQ
jgi:hypothetical protein